jgi:hypothetical protein
MNGAIYNPLTPTHSRGMYSDSVIFAYFSSLDVHLVLMQIFNWNSWIHLARNNNQWRAQTPAGELKFSPTFQRTTVPLSSA